jgi:hypothetical protein
MELLELENIWKECDLKITEGNRINKEILKRVLISKPEKTIKWMKIRSGFNLLSPLILFAWMEITNYIFYFTSSFYIGLGLFLPVFILTYIWDWEYFLHIYNFDFSDTILNIKQNIVKLEKYKVKVTQIRYILMPIAITGLLFIFCQRLVFSLEFIIMILLILIVFIASAYYRFKYSISEKFRRLNKELEEIEQIMKS